MKPFCKSHFNSRRAQGQTGRYLRHCRPVYGGNVEDDEQLARRWLDPGGFVADDWRAH